MQTTNNREPRKVAHLYSGIAARLAAMALVALVSILGVRGAHGATSSAVSVISGNATNTLADFAYNAVGQGGWTNLSDIVIQEPSGSDGKGFVPSQTGVTLVLSAPSGWQFRPGVGTVTTNAADINSLAWDIQSTTITVTFSTGSGSSLDKLTISGVQVQALDGSKVGLTSYVFRTAANPGTATIAGIFNNSTKFAELRQIPGVAKQLIVTLPGETFTANTGNAGTASGQVAGTSFGIAKVTAVDQFLNIATAYAGSKSLSYSGPGNSPCNNAPSYTTAATFYAGQATDLTTTLAKAQTTAITVTEGQVLGVPSSSFTVAAGAATQVSVETAANGNGSVLPAESFLTTAATAVTGYAIARDANCNFTANVAGAWSVSGSLMNSDLTVNGGGLSATFKPVQCPGTGTLHVTSGALTPGDSQLMTVTDNTFPVISGCPTDIVANTGAGRLTCDQVVTWVAPTANDNCTVTNFSSNYASGATFPVGTTTVTYTAKDSSGNTTTRSFTVTVADNTAPVFSGCPADIVTNTGAGHTTCDQVVTWTEPTATDNCAVTNQSSTYASGATFPVGTTTVTYTAKDASGNPGTCTFTVTVVDDTKPVVVTKNVDLKLLPGSDWVSTSANEVFDSEKSTDNCGTVMAVSLDSTTFYCAGVYTVTLTAADQNGNNNTATATVTVTDERPAKATVFVDASYANLLNGALVNWPANNPANPGHNIGCDAFATIQEAINHVATNGTVMVAPGTYAEQLFAYKAVTLKGAQAGQDANLRSEAFQNTANGPKADPALESIITAAVTAPGEATNDTLHIAADNVTVDGFVFDGNNADLPQADAVVLGGIQTDSRRAIETADASGNLVAANFVTVQNSIIQNFAERGVELANATETSPVTLGSLVTGNVVRNFGISGIYLAYNAYCDITHNTVVMGEGAEAGLQLYGFKTRVVYLKDGRPPRVMDWSFNTVTVSQDAFGGIWANYARLAGLTLNIRSNVVNAATGVTGASGYTFGIFVSTFTDGAAANIEGNMVGSSGGEFARGIAVWNHSSPVTVAGGTVGHARKGVSLHYFDPNFGPAYADNQLVALVSGVSVAGAETGVLVSATNAAVAAVQATISATAISNNQVGIDVNGATALIEKNDLSGNTVAGIRVENNAQVDAGNCGVSAGANNLTGYGVAGSYAIQDWNANGQANVQAEYNNFGIVAGDNVGRVLFDSGDDTAYSTIYYSQNPAVLKGPDNVVVSCPGAVPLPVQMLDANFTFSANTEGSTLSWEDTTQSGTCANRYDITRTYTAQDRCGVSATYVQTIKVDNESLPVITSFPADVTASCPGDVQPANDSLVIAADVCGGEVTVTHADDVRVNGGCPNQYTLTRTYHVVDSCGNSTNLVQTITVDDKTGPSITTDANSLNRTLECDNAAGLAEARNLKPEATDTWPGEVTLHLLSDVTNSLGCANSFVETRTWNFTDACGNPSASFVQTITVHDTTKPTFTSVPGNVTVDCSASIYPTNNPAVGVAQGADNCDASPVISYTDTETQVGKDHVVKTVSRQWTIKDACGNQAEALQTITVQDTVAPVITKVPSDFVLLVNEDCVTNMPDLTHLVEAYDSCGSVSISQEPQQDTPLGVQDLLVTITATDGVGNMEQRTLTIAVRDQTAPTIESYPTNSPIEADALTGKGAIPTLTNLVDTFDNCSPLLWITQDPPAGTLVGLGITNVTLTVVDQYDNTNSCVATVTVADTTKPVVSCPGNVEVPANSSCSAAVTWPPATATDNCTPADELGIKYLMNYGQLGQEVEVHSGDIFPVGPTIITAVATDGSGNQGICTFQVVVKDTTAPVVKTKDITVHLGSAGSVSIAAADVDAGSSDNCQIASMVVVPDTFTGVNVGANSVTLTVTDAGGNSASANATVTVLAAADVSVAIASVADPVTLGGNVTYQISVNNAGPSAATGVTLSNYLTAGQLSLTVASNGAPAQASPFPGPLAWWPAQGNANDVAGTNVGKLSTTGVTYVAGQVGQAFSFDGVRGSIAMADSPSLRPASLTIEGWIRPQTVGQRRVIIGKRLDSAAWDSFALWIDSDVLSAAVADNSGFGPVLSCSVQSGEWVHVAYSFDATTQAQALYVNGVLVDAGVANKVIAYDTHPVVLGNDNQNGALGTFYCGEVDELSLYNRALTGAEVAAVFNAGSAGKCRTPGVIALGDIASGASVQVSVVTAPTTCQAVSLAASATSTVLDSSLNNNTATTSVAIQAPAEQELRLSVTPVAGNSSVVRLEWPLRCSLSEIESADSLNGPVLWRPVTLPTLRLEQGNGMIVPANEAMKYFRVHVH